MHLTTAEKAFISDSLEEDDGLVVGGDDEEANRKSLEASEYLQELKQQIPRPNQKEIELAESKKRSYAQAFGTNDSQLLLLDKEEESKTEKSILRQRRRNVITQPESS